MSDPDKTLPAGADGDDSIATSNDEYAIDVGETESGTWVWQFDGHSTLYHEFFALQSGTDGAVHFSYEDATVEEYFPDTRPAGEKGSAVVSLTVDGSELLVKRTVRMHEQDPTFTMKYDITNVGSETVDALSLFQYADFDDGSSDYTDDVGEYSPADDAVFVRDVDGSAFAGFSADRASANHHVGEYPEYDVVRDASLNNNDRFPTGSGADDPVVIQEWDLGDLAPGRSASLTLQFGAETQQSLLVDNVRDPDPVDTEPPRAGVGGSATVFSWVPGLSENDDEGGDDAWSAFPNTSPSIGAIKLPVVPPTDKGFLGDGWSADDYDNEEIARLGETVQETLDLKKGVQGLDGEYNRFRVKNTVDVFFQTTSEGTIDTARPIDVRVNSRTPDDWEHESNIDGDPDVRVDYLDPDDPEAISKTILEEGSNLLNKDYFDSRTKDAYDRKRFLTVTVDEFTVGGETQEGVRVATLWGAENSYTRKIQEIEKHGLGGLPGANPIIYHWIDLIVLADGTSAVRVHDATQFPMHTLYTGPSGRPDAQEPRADSGLEIVYDTDATTSAGEFRAAVNEGDHEPWSQFYESFENGTHHVPYNTGRKEYLKHFDDEENPGLLREGYINEWLVDHPMMEYGTDPSGTELTSDEIESLMESGDESYQVPFPGLL